MLALKGALLKHIYPRHIIKKYTCTQNKIENLYLEWFLARFDFFCIIKMIILEETGQPKDLKVLQTSYSYGSTSNFIMFNLENIFPVPSCHVKNTSM
jgi:hypothetical protein